MTPRQTYDAWHKGLTHLVDQLPIDQLVDTVAARLLTLVSTGFFTPDRAAYEIHNRIFALLDDPLDAYIQRIWQSVDDTLTLVNTVYSHMGVDVSRDIPRIRGVERVLQANLGRYKDSTLDAIAERLRIAAIDRHTVQEMAAEITKLDGVIERHAITIARTTLTSTGQVAKNEKAAVAGIEYAIYLGDIRPGRIRPFCLSHVRNTYHISTILELRNNNLEPVIEHCGGWNCIHQWEWNPQATAEKIEPRPDVEPG